MDLFTPVSIRGFNSRYFKSITVWYCYFGVSSP